MTHQREVSPWVKHVRAYAKAKGINYFDALQRVDISRGYKPMTMAEKASSAKRSAKRSAAKRSAKRASKKRSSQKKQTHKKAHKKTTKRSYKKKSKKSSKKRT